MKYKFLATDEFEKAAKRLHKKYPSLPSDLLAFKNEYTETSGTDLGDGFRKVRLLIKSKKTGKSGGGRIITNNLDIVFSEEQNERYVVLVDMYDKSEQETISREKYKQIFDEYMKLN